MGTAGKRDAELLLAMLGHELRTPLATVVMSAEAMRARAQLTVEDARSVDRILESSVRMRRLIDDIVEAMRARAQGIPVVRVTQDVRPIVERIADELRAAEPGCTIRLDVRGGCVAPIDGDRFEQVVSNLVANALVHGDRARPITVALGPHGREALVLCVHNHGRAIAPEVLPALFDPFTRGEGDGLGLGLFIAQRIVEAHGGRIDVRSCPTDGTTFEVKIPSS